MNKGKVKLKEDRHHFFFEKKRKHITSYSYEGLSRRQLLKTIRENNYVTTRSKCIFRTYQSKRMKSGAMPSFLCL